MNDDQNRERREEASFDDAVLGAQRVPTELATIMDCFAKLDGNTVGGFAARWMRKQNVFLYGDSKVSFECLTNEGGQGEARITIESARQPFEVGDQTITMRPRCSTERQFTWKGKFPEDRELTSVT
ncbi:MAG: hypothetical protein QOJ51_6674 [Acidobacteriaceae bacterium]|jgi:hypothetical protein|nr:hypothetical protein [Acidobacteriaceae bacterium]MEA2263849.1 hypothetical protein [Acidobacteriaceae bacterium]